MIFWKLVVRMQLHKRLNARGLAPRARFELATLRLTAERDKNLSAASGVAYIRRGAILTFLAAPNPAPKSIRNQHTTADARCPTTPFLDNFRVADHSLRTPHDVSAISIGLKAQACGYGRRL